VLVVGFDVALLAGMWLFGLLIAESRRVPMPAILTTLRTSYRAQLTTVLAAFVLPVLGFARGVLPALLMRHGALEIFSFARPCATRRPVRRRLCRVHPMMRVNRSSSSGDARRGALAVSPWHAGGEQLPVLAGARPGRPFLNPDAFRVTLADEIDITMDATTAGRPTRVGYRVVAGPPGSKRCSPSATVGR
jgi:hypothetical protein